MTLLRFVALLSLSGGLLLAGVPGSGSGETPGAAGADHAPSNHVASVPPVLRAEEPADTGTLVLPHSQC